MTNQPRSFFGGNHESLPVRRMVFHPSGFLSMYFAFQIGHSIGSAGRILEQRRIPHLVMGEQLGENLVSSDARSQGLDRRCKFRLALLINLGLRARCERSQGNTCSGESECNWGGCCGLSSAHVISSPLILEAAYTAHLEQQSSDTETVSITGIVLPWSCIPKHRSF